MVTPFDEPHAIPKKGAVVAARHRLEEVRHIVGRGRHAGW